VAALRELSSSRSNLDKSMTAPEQVKSDKKKEDVSMLKAKTVHKPLENIEYSFENDYGVEESEAKKAASTPLATPRKTLDFEVDRTQQLLNSIHRSEKVLNKSIAMVETSEKKAAAAFN
jgi:hypothetical protein